MGNVDFSRKSNFGKKKKRNGKQSSYVEAQRENGDRCRWEAVRCRTGRKAKTRLSDD